MVQHWVFAAQYYKIALTFELAFKMKSREVEERQRKQELFVTVANAIAYSFLLICLIILIFWQSTSVILFIYLFTNLGIASVLTYSMIKLRQFSKLLVADGIIASDLLMMIHLTSFWVVSILDIGACFAALFVITGSTIHGKKNDKGQIAKEYISASVIVTFAIMMVTMLAMFIKHGTLLSPAEKAKISMRFIKQFNSG